MERHVNPLSEYLKEIAWAVLIVDVIIGLCALLLAPRIGVATAAWVCAGFAAVVTCVVGGIVLVNVTLAWLYGRWERRMDREQDR